jgi:hypothetical protein
MYGLRFHLITIMAAVLTCGFSAEKLMASPPGTPVSTPATTSTPVPSPAATANPSCLSCNQLATNWGRALLFSCQDMACLHKCDPSNYPAVLCTAPSWDPSNLSQCYVNSGGLVQPVYCYMVPNANPGWTPVYSILGTSLGACSQLWIDMMGACDANYCQSHPGSTCNDLQLAQLKCQIATNTLQACLINNSWPTLTPPKTPTPSGM